MLTVKGKNHPLCSSASGGNMLFWWSPMPTQTSPSGWNAALAAVPIRAWPFWTTEMK
jgi:hypothetical protein